MIRKLTLVRRSLHNAFKRREKCKDYLKLLPNGGFLYNLVKADLNATNKVITKLRDDEMISRFYNNTDIDIPDPGPAYPEKAVKTKIII